MAEVAMCLAFARLSREDVEVISDVSPMAALITRGGVRLIDRY